jgi:transitional endoplasmic reticulum ATPase
MQGSLARVVAIEKDIVHLALANGSRATATPAGQLGLVVGDIAYIDTSGSSLTKAPQSVWPEAAQIGVVIYADDQQVILHSDHRSVIVASPTYSLTIGSTVKFAEVSGIQAVLSDTPLSIPSLDYDELVDISKYRVPLSKITDTLDAFIGSELTKRRAKQIVELPLKHPELFKSIGAGKINGALFYGPSGTGKTMLARIIAKNLGAELFVVRGPEVDSKWVGTSERTLRAIFDEARRHPRAIIVLDELDALAPRRGPNTHHSDNKVVATLLSLLDGVASDGDAFVIGTTNLPQSVDTALLRSSRFHWQIEFPLPDERERLGLLSSAASRISVGDDIDLASAVENTAGWSGDDINGI